MSLILLVFDVLSELNLFFYRPKTWRLHISFFDYFVPIFIFNCLRYNYRISQITLSNFTVYNDFIYQTLGSKIFNHFWHLFILYVIIELKDFICFYVCIETCHLLLLYFVLSGLLNHKINGVIFLPVKIDFLLLILIKNSLSFDFFNFLEDIKLVFFVFKSYALRF